MIFTFLSWFVVIMSNRYGQARFLLLLFEDEEYFSSDKILINNSGFHLSFFISLWELLLLLLLLDILGHFFLPSLLREVWINLQFYWTFRSSKNGHNLKYIWNIAQPHTIEEGWPGPHGPLATPLITIMILLDVPKVFLPYNLSLLIYLFPICLTFCLQNS